MKLELDEEDEEFTKNDASTLDTTGEESIADADVLKQDVIAFVEEKYDVNSDDDNNVECK